jgi:hypothetical protein
MEEEHLEVENSFVSKIPMNFGALLSFIIGICLLH